MESATGGSGEGGENPPGKGKITVGPPDKPKKMSTWQRAMLRYLQGKHEDAVAAGEEPPFGGRYAPPLVSGQTIPTPSRDKLQPSSSKPKDT